MNLKTIGKLSGCVISVYLLLGCLASTHHFRKGELLKSGESEINWGGSFTKTQFCNSGNYKDSDGFKRCTNNDWRETDWVVLSRSFRLGVRDKWGPFTGVELGYQLESNLVMEFDLRLGLPLPDWYPFKTVHHAAGAGWGLGGFPDNTYFLDYAVSKKISERTTYYLTFRESWLSTQLIDTETESDTKASGDLFQHHRRFYHQLGVGMEIVMPIIYMFPDQFHLQLMLAAPELSMVGNPRPDFRIHYQFNIGVGWHY